jgi:hypothetical protein
MAENAYDLLRKTYEKQQAAINAQQQLQSQEKADREALAKQTLESHNRGVYTTYKNAINPYGTVASQTNRPTGTSEYMKNAAYGTMLQGLGQNQANYSADMQSSNSLWAAYLAEKAGQEADLESNYANAIIAQQNADKELAAIGSSSGTGGSPKTEPTEITDKDKITDWTPYKIDVVTENGKKYYYRFNKAGQFLSKSPVPNSSQTGNAYVPRDLSTLKTVDYQRGSGAQDTRHAR